MPLSSLSFSVSVALFQHDNESTAMTANEQMKTAECKAKKKTN